MQTAWLKAHYPHEYMAAVLTSYTGKTDKIVHYVSACRHDGIPVLSPDVNESGTEFTATRRACALVWPASAAWATAWRRRLSTSARRRPV